MKTDKITVPAEKKQLAAVMALINNKMDRMNCTPRTRMQVRVTVDEIFCNVVRYAYDNEGTVTVEAGEGEDPPCLVLTFIDQGVPFNPLNVQEPDLTGSAKKHRVGGWGVYIVKRTMDKIAYEYKDNSNVLTIWKYV